MALCSACVFASGWFAQEQKTAKARLAEVLLMGLGISAMPYLIYLGTRPMDDETLIVDITATGLLIWVFASLNIHLGIQTRKIYRQMNDQKSGQ